MRKLKKNTAFFVNLNQTIKIPNLSSPKKNLHFNKTFCTDAQHRQKESAFFENKALLKKINAETPKQHFSYS